MAKTILIVDDEPDVLKMESFRVRRSGYEVVTAVNGEEALQAVRQRRPDLVLLDVRMPVMQGTAVCAQIKSDTSLRSIPVVLVTASSDSVVECVKGCGADDYLLKPFDSDELLAKVKKFVGE